VLGVITFDINIQKLIGILIVFNNTPLPFPRTRMSCFDTFLPAEKDVNQNAFTEILNYLLIII